jgi:hydrogenase maturation protease
LRKVVVIGVGNPHRGDDAAGREVVRRLRDWDVQDVEIVELDGEAASVLVRLEGASAAILIDACVSGSAPGTVQRFDVANAPLPGAAFGLSSHGFGLAEAMDLARSLDIVPPFCVVFAIEGACFELGAPLSPSIAAAIDDVVLKLRDEIATLSRDVSVGATLVDVRRRFPA